MKLLQDEDLLCLFAAPVTDQVAHNYYDVIKNPMDLQTMAEMVDRGGFDNYAWIRESFEQMVYNALIFNRPYTQYWNEAKRYYNACLQKVFAVKGKGAPPSKYSSMITECFAKAERELQAEKDRDKTDETAEKKDLVAGSQIVAINLELAAPVDPKSYVPNAELRLTLLDAFYSSWMECCFVCGSSGATDTMLFCVDCGEAFHSFCVNAPVQSMTEAAFSGFTIFS